MDKAPVAKTKMCRCVHTLHVSDMHYHKCIALATRMSYTQPETSMMAYQGPPFSGMPLL